MNILKRPNYFPAIYSGTQTAIKEFLISVTKHMKIMYLHVLCYKVFIVHNKLLR